MSINSWKRKKIFTAIDAKKVIRIIYNDAFEIIEYIFQLSNSFFNCVYVLAQLFNSIGNLKIISNDMNYISNVISNISYLLFAFLIRNY